MDKPNNKRSQAPVALVYFITLLLFMGIFGFIAYKLIVQMNSWKKEETSSEVYTDPSFNLLFARTTQTGDLAEAALLRFSPEEDCVIVVPISSHTINETDNLTMYEVYGKGGIRNLEKGVEETFGVDVDHYITVDSKSFENVCDIIGGIVYTPSEVLYKLAENDADDISFQAGKAVDLSGHQIAMILVTDVFSNGWGANAEFHGNILEQLVNSAFQQSNFTKTSLDNIYSQLISGGENNYTKNDFSTNKRTLGEMLDKHLNKPVILEQPDGEWREGDRFKVSQAYVNELKEVFGGSKTQNGAAFTAESVTTAAAAPEVPASDAAPAAEPAPAAKPAENAAPQSDDTSLTA